MMRKKKKKSILVTILFQCRKKILKNLNQKDPLDILAYQYDLVCNGYELSSGAIRNHIPEYLFKVFEKVGYSKKKGRGKFFWYD